MSDSPLKEQKVGLSVKFHFPSCFLTFFHLFFIEQISDIYQQALFISHFKKNAPADHAR